MGQEPPPMLELGLCHMKPISNPYLGHIWVTPVPQIGLWTFEPAFSPRFLPTLSPRSFFQTGQRFLPILSPRSFLSTGQRFPISNHVTSGSHEPAILFIHWSAVSHTGNDMTSSSGHVIALDQSEASLGTKRAPFTTLKSNVMCMSGNMHERCAV